MSFWKQRCGLSTKDTNPKTVFGDAKAPLSTVPMPIIYELALAMLEGALKYGRHNYRMLGIRHSTYYDAACRHLTAWWEGEDIDPDSGLPHLTKAMACLAILRDAQMLGLAVDDRPPSHPNGWQEQLAKKAQMIKDKYPEPKEPFLKEDNTGS